MELCSSPLWLSFLFSRTCIQCSGALLPVLVSVYLHSLQQPLASSQCQHRQTIVSDGLTCQPCLWRFDVSALSLMVWSVSLVCDSLKCQPGLCSLKCHTVSALSLIVCSVSLVSVSLMCQPCLWRSDVSTLSLTVWSVSRVSDSLMCQSRLWQSEVSALSLTV